MLHVRITKNPVHLCCSTLRNGVPNTAAPTNTATVTTSDDDASNNNGDNVNNNDHINQQYYD